KSNAFKAAKQRGININVSSGKALADSLDHAVDAKNPMLNRLLRMLTTRCMTQAVYFSAGTIPVPQYQHFGLACPIYTHFTSPIRRYADVVVHRLLAACIGADDIKAQKRTICWPSVCAVECVDVFSRTRRDVRRICHGCANEWHTGTVFVPKYGLESVIVLQQGKGTTIDIEEFCVRSGEHVIRELVMAIGQRRRIALDLIEPSTMPGLSVDFDLSESIGVGI
ncbi:hypothetical protein OSTOST_16049, partial [Ostertagia ostertagi]